MKTTLLLIRHGETAKNITGTIHKKDDESLLTELGKKQMEQVAVALKNMGVDLVYCSESERTNESADIICKALDVKKHVIPDIHERSWGILEETPWLEVEKMLNDMKLSERYEYLPEKGESWKDVESRASKQIKKVISNGERCIVVISHGGVIRALIPWLLKSSKEKGLVEISNGSISTFVFENDEMILSEINNTSHLTD